MANSPQETVLWEDRKHHLWFPLSFTKYQLTDERLYTQTGLLNTHYDELLLYRIIDICLERSLGQKIFGTGTIILSTKADSQGTVMLQNISRPLEVKAILSQRVEEIRETRGVVGREFYTHEANEGEEPF